MNVLLPMILGLRDLVYRGSDAGNTGEIGVACFGASMAKWPGLRLRSSQAAYKES